MSGEIWDFSAWRALTRYEIDRSFPVDPGVIVAAYGHPDSPVDGDESAFLLFSDGEVSAPTKFEPGIDADPIAKAVPFTVFLAAAEYFEEASRE